MSERGTAEIGALLGLRDKMKKRFAAVIALVITIACGCFDYGEYEKLGSDSSVVILCRNHVKDGMVWAEITEIWRDASNGVFTNKVTDTLETHVPVEPQTDCGETSIMFYGGTRGSLLNYRTLYVHDGKVSGHVTVEKFRSMIRDSLYSGKELEMPCRTSGDMQRSAEK